jgi:DNA-binding CsgD family transcriptional regulator/tetratricopeptide (TPR) repeat protein
MPARNPHSATPEGSTANGGHRPPLVGRDAELHTLLNALSDADARRGSAVLLVGESGVGKTRLVTALAEQAAQRGFDVAVGRGYPVETGVPYAVFADALLPLLRRLDPSALTLLTRGGTEELAQLFPVLAAAARPGSASARGDPSEVKARLLWNFSQFLSRYAARRPLLVVLENLQWADSASLEMLHFVARQLGDDRLLVVATHNDPELRGNPALRAAELSLRNLGAVERLRLAPLQVDGVGELLARWFEVDASRVAPFAERLHRWTGGNPFFIDEMLKSLIESGQLARRHGGWVGWGVDELRVPATIREATLARLADLPAEARRLADTAAVLGGRATYDELAAVAELQPDALIAAIDRLRSHDVLAEREEGGEIIYDFSHPLLQETLYSELGLARTRALHGAIAEALERLYGADAMRRAGELAFHYARGDRRRLAGKAVQYLRAAGRDASAKYANREAADYLAAALEIADQERGADADSVVPELALELVGELARVRQRLGEYAAALELWDRALTGARERADWERVATIERSIGLARHWSGSFHEALVHFDAALDAARLIGDTRLEARILIPRASCRQAVGDPEPARADIERALTIAADLGDEPLLARVHRALLLLHLWTGPAERAREHGMLAVELANRSNQRGVEWSARWALAALAGLTGQSDKLRAHLAEAQRLADELRSPVYRVSTAEVEIELAAGTGDWDHAVAVAERTIAIARVIGQHALAPRPLVWLGLIYLGRGDIERGKACVDEAWELSAASDASNPLRDVHTIVPAHIGRAAYHLAIGDYPEAIHVGEKGLRIADRSGYVVWAIHRLMPIIAEASLWANDIERAKAIGERLRRQSAVLGQRLGLAWADACEALVELLGGDAARAVALLHDAIAALEAIPFVADAARLRRRLAMALAAIGDRDGATRELRQAHDVFARLGAERELDATRDQLRELGARPPTRITTPGIAGLTGREVEIVRLVAARRSNKEIGAALGISARTASTHLSNIFAKLGVESRGELADRARVEGLV